MYGLKLERSMAIKNRSANLFDGILSDFKARFARVSKDSNSVQE